MRPAILGLSGTRLDAGECALLEASPPAGIILFARNIADPAQLGSLTAELRAILPHGAVLMVDQEGGRVARLRPPYWRTHPAAAALGLLPDRQAERAAWLSGALIGHECAEIGLDVVTAPVLDVRSPGADPVIGDRAFAADPAIVAKLGAAFADGLLAAGIQPVGKHVPGHGRATADSHEVLPRLAAPTPSDLAPFRALAPRLPWLMTAHILYRDLDPERPATLSPTIIARLIRGELAFDGVLVSDDLTMRALSGEQAVLARAAIEAGCDLALSCAGDLATNAAILAALPPMTEATARRLAAAASMALNARQPLDAADLDAQRDRHLA